MEFDKSKVYTALNADELKVGSKIIAAKNLHALRDLLCENNPFTLVDIRSENYQDRFVSTYTDFTGEKHEITTTLAYLVEPPEEKKLKWQDLKVGDIIKCKSTGIKYLVTAIDSRELTSSHIFISDFWVHDSAISFDFELENYEKVEE